jgi:hypothetical protein
MSPDIPKEAREWLAKIGRKGGHANTPKQVAHRKMFATGKHNRRYKPCSKPVPSRVTSKLHLFDKAGRCYGCGKTKGELAT